MGAPGENLLFSTVLALHYKSKASRLVRNTDLQSVLAAASQAKYSSNQVMTQNLLKTDKWWRENVDYNLQINYFDPADYEF